MRAHGGCISQEDLERYRVIRRRPVTASFCGEEYVSNPPPSAGGILIAYGLPLLEEIGPGSPGTAEAMDVGGLTILVAAIEDLIAMKRAAGRPKDLIEIEVLAAVREERHE